MTDRLPFSPLTHEELNARSGEAIKTAGHRGLTLGLFGDPDAVSPRDLAVFRQARLEFDAYNDAALVRCSVPIGGAA